MPNQPTNPTHVLITAGPTYEPIDAVRFIGNRSSGKMGIALAREAAARGFRVTLLMGPAPTPLPHEWTPTSDTGVRALRFRTCADLQTLLARHAPEADVLIMAAAVADFRPKVDPAQFNGKFRRTSATLTLSLEPTPDLLAEVASKRRPGQFLVGFALEPRADVDASAAAKLARKRVDVVVGNPLETMDSEAVEAMVLSRDGVVVRTPGLMPKPQFAPWLLDQLQAARSRLAAHEISG